MGTGILLLTETLLPLDFLLPFPILKFVGGQEVAGRLMESPVAFARRGDVKDGVEASTQMFRLFSISSTYKRHTAT